ncbi:hypothetical protein GUJ93_ZPchr0458g22294 [Zizania palustris]|uniref:Disease resistance protein At4g27190-like leucine-rich repeats domain-containing protein n=1 Tax=Zizania palustris TaxID=103762 RepID=A0A8J5UUP9_ZIZPA|nr:hypothetical protein GUJ93_ZPchr0458g22294 [Zizania palustris]
MDTNCLDEKVLAFHNLTQLQSLEITCSSLVLDERHLRMLTSLKSLTIDGSSITFNPLESRSDIKWHLSVERLCISKWRSIGKDLTQLLCHLPKLSYLDIKYCDELTGLCVAVEQHQTTVVMELEDNQQQEVAEDQSEEEEMVTQQSVDQQDEDGLLLFPAHLSDSLRELLIMQCCELILVPPPLHNGHDHEGWGLQALRSLERLHISYCSKFLSTYNTSTSCFPPSLQYFDIWYCWSTKGCKMEFLSNLSSLTTLYIAGDDLTCEGMWPLLTHGQLHTLIVYDAPKFFAGLDPILGLQEPQLVLLKRSFKLQELHTDDMSGFLVKPICSLLSSSLTHILFLDNDVAERFTEEQEEALQLLTSLQYLEFSGCEKLQCLPVGLHRLTNLKRLDIWDCPSIQSLPKGSLPSSLEELQVNDCKKLQCLPEGLHRLTNLKRLQIWKCPSIQSLPKGGLPSTLEKLHNLFGNKGHRLGFVHSFSLVELSKPSMHRSCHTKVEAIIKNPRLDRKFWEVLPLMMSTDYIWSYRNGCQIY